MSRADGTIYVLQARPPAIIALSPDGSNQRTIIGLTNTPDGLQVDPANQVLYWSNMGSDENLIFANNDGTINRANLDGSNHRILVPSGLAGTPKQIEHDRAAGLLYWCDREGMRVMRSQTDGRDVTVLVQTGTFPKDTDDQMRWCVGIAVDKTNAHIYWTQKGPDNAGKGRIFRAGLELPEGQLPTDRRDIELLIDGLPEPIDLALDHARSVLYWTDRGNRDGGNTLNRAKISKRGLSHHEIVADGLEEGIGLTLDLPNHRAFISDLGGNIWLCDLLAPIRSPLKRIAKLGILTGIEFAVCERLER